MPPSPAATSPVPSRRPRRLPGGARARWSATFALLLAIQAAWALATPLMTGPDESSHAVRAAAVARGQLAGDHGPDLLGSPNVFVRVRVPEAYGRADSAAVCFLGTSRTGRLGGQAPGTAPECSGLDGGDRQVTAATLQYRGQPLYYALVGWTSRLSPDATGMYLMRLATAAIVAAVLASAFASARLLPAPRLGAAAVGLTATPVVLSLGGSVNSSAVEVAAAVGLWAGAAALARAPEVGGRLVARTGLAAALLVSARGLGPVFALVVLAAMVPVAGRERLRALFARRDLRWWLGIAALSFVASATWLAWIQAEFPLAERPGSGIGHAVGLVPYFLQQTVTVFSVNDVELPWAAGLLWLVPVLALVTAAWRRGTGWARVLPVGVAVAAVVLDVTAEGASLPPIGYFWQGRYVLPLLVGVPVLAAALADRDPQGATPRGDAAASGRGSGVGWPAVAAAAAAVALHAWAFLAAGRHFASRGPDRLGWADALTDPRWQPPLLPLPAWAALVLAAAAALAALVLAPPSVDAPRPRGSDALRS
jgi:hypothetical protein